MLSINIPVYNIEVVELVKQLSAQAKAMQIQYEIRVYDDGSDELIKSINRYVRQLSNVIYVELEQNLGRSAIRNKMGLDSKYDYLLFIDADSCLVKPDYLKDYINNSSSEQILCGGTVYSPEKPIDKDKLLRWTYGHNREAVSAESRNRKKGFVITSNNFLIPKAIFEQVHFREDLKKYGHEDTLLGFDLFKNDFNILHIENPVEHTGLESSQLFLSKTKMALRNLKVVTEELLEGDNDFIKQIIFLNTYKRITTVLPNVFLTWCFTKYEKRLLENLSSQKPYLRYFDLYKLGYYSSLKNR